MSVYVDPMMSCVPNPRWRWTENCHLVADTLDELHAFAHRLGLKRAWFQGADVGSSVPHYDLTRQKRETAVRFGAVELDRRGMGEFLKKHRAKGAAEAATGNLFG